ncbi:unnamed protein product [Miscanthus lutarioriparius]|uniref:Uncharacterized protein n=1 Tax=Miscanthus lutarioriparius TaxID=422564 RepID=A0A811P3D2_9POAL|nr:unnamed protein product [Miscanthus lutarioriparius]
MSSEYMDTSEGTENHDGRRLQLRRGGAGGGDRHDGCGREIAGGSSHQEGPASSSLRFEQLAAWRHTYVESAALTLAMVAVRTSAEGGDGGTGPSGCSEPQPPASMEVAAPPRNSGTTTTSSHSSPQPLPPGSETAEPWASRAPDMAELFESIREFISLHIMVYYKIKRLKSKFQHSHGHGLRHYCVHPHRSIYR